MNVKMFKASDPLVNMFIYSTRWFSGSLYHSLESFGITYAEIDMAIASYCLCTYEPVNSTGWEMMKHLTDKPYNEEIDMPDYKGEALLLMTDANNVVRDAVVLMFDEGTPFAEYENHRREEEFRRLIGSNYSHDVMFGGHLAKKNPKKIVAVVQDEMTAILGSIVLPDFTWVAAGYGRNLTIASIESMHACRVRLFPDEMAADRWRSIADVKKLPNVSISLFFAGKKLREQEILLNIYQERKER